ncbi:MAG: hypothetical protein ACT4OF_05460 [Caulobacteraceae bacterium]
MSFLLWTLVLPGPLLSLLRDARAHCVGKRSGLICLDPIEAREVAFVPLNWGHLPAAGVWPIRCLDDSLQSPERSLWERHSHDLYFREGWDSIADVFGARFVSSIERLAIVVFKPDAVAARKLEDGVDFLIENGFHPTACGLFHHNRHTIRETWRYQLAGATLESLAIVDAYLSLGPSLVLFLEDTAPVCGPLGAERLLHLKGGGQPTPGQLRNRLGLSNVFLSFVHTPDDLGDLIREIAIYFGGEERLAHLRHHAQGTRRRADVARHVHELYAQSPVHDLSLARSLSRVAEASRRQMSLDMYDAQVRPRCELLAAKATRAYPELFLLLDRQGVKLDPWDRIVVAAEFCEWSKGPPQPRSDTLGPSLIPGKEAHG